MIITNLATCLIILLTCSCQQHANPCQKCGRLIYSKHCDNGSNMLIHVSNVNTLAATLNTLAKLLSLNWKLFKAVSCQHRSLSQQSLFMQFFLCFTDECEEVEHQVQKVIQEMEAILGEPLQSYF